MIITKKVPPFIEVTCEPDDEYKYLKCESSIVGLFFLRVKDKKANLFVVQNDIGVWGDDLDMSDFRPNTTCDVTEVTKKIKITLPTKAVYDNIGNN
jgi:hypothetical protein